MPRHFWVSASIAMLVAAFALFAFALPRLYLLDAPASQATDRAALEVATYQVPPAQAEAISNTMNSVLFAFSKEGVQPIGQASLPAPDRLVVSAPARMQASIRRAITALSQDEAATTTPHAQASVDIWLVEALAAEGPADPRLAVADEVLEAARQRFGHRQYRLLERLMIQTDVGGISARTAGALIRRVDLQLVGSDRGVEAQVQLAVGDERGPGNFGSKLSLPEGQWQLVGLLSSSGATPERLLLMRQVPVPATNAGQ